MNLIYAYYENGQMLDEHIRVWQTYSDWAKSKLKVYLVDDGSQRDPAIGHLKSVGFPIHLYRVIPNIPWNMTGARNLAMHNATDGWCLMLDADLILPADQVDRLLARRWKADYYYMPETRDLDLNVSKRHPNAILCTRKKFWESGGYDEDLAGYYGSDGPFKRAMDTVAKQVKTDDFYIIRVGREDIPDASTVDWGRKGTEYSTYSNPVLAQKVKKTYKAENPLRFDWEAVCVI